MTNKIGIKGPRTDQSLLPPYHPFTHSASPASKPGLIRFFFSRLGKVTPSCSLCFSPPVPLLLWVWEIHSVLYQGVVRALCLHTLLNSSNDSRQTSVQGRQVRLGQDRLDRVESQRLPHGRTQGSASQQVYPVPGGHTNPDRKKAKRLMV